MRNIAESLDKMAGGMHPVIDTEVPIEDVAAALKRMESRHVFGKIVVYF
jgi:alcohol dehydrogenase